jgi:hypothetical protein
MAGNSEILNELSVKKREQAEPPEAPVAEKTPEKTVAPAKSKPAAAPAAEK